ncbi:MAG: 6,7-dimethyl-8-ribityllumazine synthase [Actinomycetaceae bacterium]|nr:6,7-dimethyl-8-ribityllumazine synthase [Actinomycetaceae bacterium]
MAGSGIPQLKVDGTDLEITIVASRWHDTVMNGLIEGAKKAVEAAGGKWKLVRVAGSLELPLGAQAAIGAGADAVVALGVVIRGDTPHFDYVCQGATVGLTEVSLKTGIPIGFGVLTVDTEEQALARAGLPGSAEDKGAEAAEAAIDLVRTMQQLAR